MRLIAPTNLVGEFNEYWVKESLPFWLKHGAKHIGSFVNYVGGPINETLRLFEFNNVEHWQQFEEALAKSEEGQNLRRELISRFQLTIERRLLLPIQTD